MAMIDVTTDNFEQEVVSSPHPVLLDFWAEWCGPCKALAPALDELAKEFDGKLRIAKIDIDKSRALAERYNVRTIPTLAIVKSGVVVDIKIGAASKARIAAWITDKI